MERRAFWWQPDPSQAYFVQPRGGKLVRRGTRAYGIVWKTPNGTDAETPLAGSVRGDAGAA